MLDAPFPWQDFWWSLPVTALAVVVMFGVVCAIAVRGGRHAVVDVAWGLGFVVVAAVSGLVASLQPVTADFGWFAYAPGPDVPGPPLVTRTELAGTLCALWGLRLAVHIWLRSRGQGEDPRYVALLAKAPGNPFWYAFTRIYLTQAAVLWFVSLPVQVAIFLGGTPGPLAWVGVAVWAVGMFFETVGDWQLTRFRNDPSTTGTVLSTGLWRFTRHPNYFGDACCWWGLSLIAFDAWPGILTVLSPLLMTWLLARGTGKPLLEKDIADRRPGYVDYVRRTSGFLPLPPKRLPHPTIEGETA